MKNNHVYAIENFITSLNSCASKPTLITCQVTFEDNTTANVTHMNATRVQIAVHYMQLLEQLDELKQYHEEDDDTFSAESN